eukprot:2716621-Rhodomonas_salina.1
MARQGALGSVAQRLRDLGVHGCERLCTHGPWSVPGRHGRAHHRGQAHRAGQARRGSPAHP